MRPTFMSSRLAIQKDITVRLMNKVKIIADDKPSEEFSGQYPFVLQRLKLVACWRYPKLNHFWKS